MNPSPGCNFRGWSPHTKHDSREWNSLLVRERRAFCASWGALTITSDIEQLKSRMLPFLQKGMICSYVNSKKKEKKKEKKKKKPTMTGEPNYSLYKRVIEDREGLFCLGCLDGTEVPQVGLLQRLLQVLLVHCGLQEVWIVLAHDSHMACPGDTPQGAVFNSGMHPLVYSTKTVINSLGWNVTASH